MLLCDFLFAIHIYSNLLYFDSVAFAFIFHFFLHLLQWLVWEAFPAEHSPAEVQAFWLSACSMCCGHRLAEHSCPHNGKKPLQLHLCLLAFQSMSNLGKRNTTGVVMSIMLEMESLEQPFSTGGSFVSTTIIGIGIFFYILIV